MDEMIEIYGGSYSISFAKHLGLFTIEFLNGIKEGLNAGYARAIQ